MYYVKLYYQNAKLNQRGKFEVSPQNRSIPKWTILSSGNKTLELLRLITLSTADPRLLSNADLSFERFFNLYDAFPKTENPLTMPGVIILHRPDSFCAGPWFPEWIRLVDSLVPNMQFIIGLSEEAQRVFPATVKNKHLRLQKPEFTAPSTARQTPPRLPQRPILLINVDGRLPNLALMELSRYYKEKGKDVVLARKNVRMNRVDEIFTGCIFNFDTTLAQDVERFRFLRSLPGAYVFVQRYRPIRTDAPAPEDIPIFDNHADRLIDELISIHFPKNMKSMEQYYRWLSRKYALTFGKLHDGLVDTIFRYNSRYKKGEYIATLAGTRKW